MLITGTANAGQEVAAEDLHVAREDDEVEVLTVQQLEHPRLGRGLLALGHGHVLVARAEALDVGGVVGMVGDHQRDLAVQLAAPPAPQQVEQAVVLARDEHGDALGPPRVVQAPLHREALGHRVRERPREVLADPSMVKAMRMKNAPPSGSVEY